MARKPQPGNLRESVRFERRAATDDGYGNLQSGDFARYYPASGGVAAAIIPLRGGESVQAERLQGTAVYEIVVRDCTGLANLTSADRVVDQRSGKIYNIRVVVNPDQLGQYLHLTCERGVAT